MRIHAFVGAAIAVTLVCAAVGCGGNASANGTSAKASVSSSGGATTGSGAAGGHSFSGQIASLGALLDRVSGMSSGTGSGQLASTLADVRTRLASVNGRLARTSFPASVQTQKQELMGFLDQWKADLGRAHQSAQGGHTARAIHEAQSSAYHDLKTLVAAVRASSVG